MPAPLVGEKVMVSYANENGSPYVLHVTVLEIAGDERIIGRVDVIFANGVGEVTGGDILSLKGQEVTFSTGDLIAA